LYTFFGGGKYGGGKYGGGRQFFKFCKKYFES
jgi:hypothetical protein